MSHNSQRIIHTDYSTSYRQVLSVSTLCKDYVRDCMGEDVGLIKEIMIDVPSGQVAYAVLSVGGGFFGIGYRLVAIPWETLTLDEDRKCFVLAIHKSRLERAPGFDKSNWPNMADTGWHNEVHEYWQGGTDYGVEAGRRYDSAAISEQEIDQKAREAREAIDGPEGESLRRAERADKDRAKVSEL